MKNIHSKYDHARANKGKSKKFITMFENSVVPFYVCPLNSTLAAEKDRIKCRYMFSLSTWIARDTRLFHSFRRTISQTNGITLFLSQRGHLIWNRSVTIEICIFCFVSRFYTSRFVNEIWIDMSLSWEISTHNESAFDFIRLRSPLWNYEILSIHNWVKQKRYLGWENITRAR